MQALEYGILLPKNISCLKEQCVVTFKSKLRFFMRGVDLCHAFFILGGVFMQLGRTVDDLGRIIIPVDIRNELNIKKRDILYFEIVGNQIVITKGKDEY